MVHFSPPNPDADALALLNRLQQDTDSQPSRKAQFERVRNLWKNRKNKQAEEALWEIQIEGCLAAGHPAPKGLCQICEHDRKAATEHYFPKRHFPNKAFDWENYLLICYRCNTLKGDRFALFMPARGRKVFHIPKKDHYWFRLPVSAPVLLNPRRDNPLDFWEIDFSTGCLIPLTRLNSRDQKRAAYTLAVFHLSTDANLQRKRRNAFSLIITKLEQYRMVRDATTIADLLAPAVPAALRAIVRHTDPFAAEQPRLLAKLRADISGTDAPAVWLHLKKQRAMYPVADALLAAVPESLSW